MKKGGIIVSFSKVTVVFLIVFSSYVTNGHVHATELTDFWRIESFMAEASGDLQAFGINGMTDTLWVGEYIPSYEIVEKKVSEIKSIRQYPVFNKNGELILFAIVFENDGIHVSLSSAYVTDINKLRDNTKQEFSFIYAANAVFLRVDTSLCLLTEYDYSIPGRDVLSYNNGSSLLCNGKTLTACHRLNIILRFLNNGIMDESDYSAYVSVPVIRQPSGSNWCWAASMASVVNYELGTTYTCTGMAYNYTTNTSEFSNLYTIQSRLNEDFSLIYYSVTNGDMLTVLNSIGEGHPLIGSFFYQIPGTNYSLGHAVVIRGINLESLYISIMDPSPDSVGNYSTCSISNFNSSTSVGTVYYVSPTNGHTYTLGAYIYYIDYYG